MNFTWLSPSDLTSVVTWTKLLFCLSTVVPSAEYLFIRESFKANGLFSGDIMALSNTAHVGDNSRAKSWLFSYGAFIGVHLTRISSCLLLLLLPTPLHLYPLSVLVVANLLFLYRNPVGNDGSDQMNLIVGVALWVLSLAPQDASLAGVSIGFIAAQSLLAYFVAGAAKFISSEWRSGLAIKSVMNTRTYGNESIAKFLKASPATVNVVLCWSIIVAELAFPLVVLLPAPYFWLIIAWGIAFHLYNAVVMGLNVFFWAFLSTYPSILFMRTLLHGC